MRSESVSLLETRSVGRRSLKRANPLLTMGDSVEEEIYSRITESINSYLDFDSSFIALFTQVNHMLLQSQYLRKRQQ